MTQANPLQETRPLPSFYTFTGPIISPILRPTFDEKGDRLDPEAERKWLRDNPRQVARIRRVEVLLSETPLEIIEPMFLFSLRGLDARAADAKPVGDPRRARNDACGSLPRLRLAL